MSVQARRKARQLALEVVYRIDLLAETPEEVLKDILEREKMDRECREFLLKEVEALKQHLEKADKLIKDSLVNWDFDRLTYIDRAILRLGVCELLGVEDVPYRVTLSEAVELAKTFSTPGAGAFINGILDTITKKLGLKEE